MSDLDLLHDGPHQLLLVLGDVQGVVVIEGRVASYEEERSSEDPEDDPPGTSQEEEGDGAEADDGVLLGQTDLVTCGITIQLQLWPRGQKRLPATESFLSLFLRPAM